MNDSRIKEWNFGVFLLHEHADFGAAQDDALSAGSGQLFGNAVKFL